MSSKTLFILVVAAAAAALLATACRPEYPKCENDEHCKEKGEYCVNGLCQQCRDNSQCGTCQQCSAGKCTHVYGCCQTDSDCGAGQKCRSGQCGPECLSNEECGGGKVLCQGGRCVPVACLGDADCPNGQTCVNNDCVGPAQCSLSTIYFDFDESVLTSSARATLDANAACLKQRGAPSLLIEGYCDERGTEEYNLALGERRARSAKDYLQRLGVGAKIRTVSYGENRPVDPGHDEGAWSRNRRDEFVIE
ncbi:MAG: OmpA family protein [Deltaproteobacteria bacterium]|nr:OmpA family protein [Deltaproteobacteria bacterium]